jgi:WD40 repeat protein
VFSPDSKTLVLLNDNGIEFYLYDAKTGELIQTIKNTSTIFDVAFTADSKHLISVGRGKDNERVILWDAHGTKIKFFTDHGSRLNVTHVLFSPDYSRLATSALPYQSGDTALILRDGPTGDIIKKLASNEKEVCVILFSPDSKSLLSGERTYTDYEIFKIWDTRAGSLKRSIKKKINFATALIAFAQDNSFLIIDDTLYDTQNWLPLITLSALTKLSTLAVSPDGNYIAAQTNDTLVLYKLFTDEILDIIKRIKSGITDLSQAYKLIQLCRKFRVKI